MDDQDKVHVIDEEDQLSFYEAVDMPIKKLTNTDKSPFWYTNKKFTSRYKHEQGEPGDIFYDGNNGDRWRVIAACTRNNRLIVQNLDQNPDLPQFIYWDEEV